MKNRTSPIMKISRPIITGILPRNRLFKALDSFRTRPVLWVSGPGGSGKTTLIASWIEARKLPCIWYQADEGDGDIATFFYYMGLAAKKASPRFRRALPLLKPEYLLDVATFSLRYFEELYSRLKPPFVLVIDNYQDVSADTNFHEIISTGLSLLPEGIITVLISRTDPLPAMARLRANGQMHVLGWSDLIFDAEEASSLVSLKGTKGFAPEVSLRIQELSGGWAAGIVLLTEDARFRDGLRAEALETASREGIFDYFASEIFQQTDPATQEFLFKTSFLRKITEQTATQLSGLSDAGRVLSDLARKNYFIQRHPGPEPAYQYHPLFRDFLQARARNVLGPEGVRAVQREAAGLLLKTGQVESAAALYADAADWESLSRMLFSHANELIQQGRSTTLQAWLTAIPREHREGDPWLLYWQAMGTLPYDLRESRACLERAFPLFKRRKDAAGLYLSWCGIVDTFVLEWSDFTPLDHWIAELETIMRADPRFPSPEIEARVASAMFCALMYRQSHHADLPLWEARVRGIVMETDDVRLKMLLSSHLALYYTWWTGDQAQAELLINALRSLLHDLRVDPLSVIVWRSIEAAYSWMRGENKACIEAVERGLDVANQNGIHLWDFMLLAQASFGAMTAGDIGTASGYLRRMEFIFKTNRFLDLSHYHYHLAWEALCLRDVSRAQAHIQTSVSLAEKSGDPFILAFVVMGFAEVLMVQGKHSEAGKHLERARAIGISMRSNTIEYQYQWLQAVRCLNRGDEQGALKPLRRHLAISRECGILNHAFWRSSVMMPLYAKALEHGIEEQFVRDLIRKRGLVPDAPPVHLENWPWRYRVYTLSRFSIVKDGKTLRFAGRVRQKPLDMLKALIALGGSDVSVWPLIEALWPDAEGDAAQRSFDTNLHRLRSMLGNDDALVLREGKLTLDSRFVWIDAWALERLLGKAAEALQQIDARQETTAALLEKALALYHGHFLPDVSEAWAVSMRERLRSKCLRAVMDLGRYWEGRQDGEKAIRCYERGLEMDDLAEELYRRIMAIYRDQGRFAEGISVYNRCREVLRARHGIDPSEDTEELHRSLRSSAKTSRS